MDRINELERKLGQVRATVTVLIQDVDGLIALAVDEPAVAVTLAEPLYGAPVGTEAERASGKIWPGVWVDATGFCRWYALGWHTGVDLNLNAPNWDADAHRPVYAIADGEVYAVRTGVQGWHTVVCVRHADCLTRYAHCENIQVREGQRVAKGKHLGNIGDAGGRYPYHLHFDIARLEARMAQYPLDWPGTAVGARERVERDYVDPLAFLRARV